MRCIQQIAIATFVLLLQLAFAQSQPKTPRPIDVEIYDQKYSIVLQTSLEEADVRSLAEEVDLRIDARVDVAPHVAVDRRQP